MRHNTFGLIALASATLSLTSCGWIGPRQQSQQTNNSCCPNCPCCQNGHRGVVAAQDRPDNRRDGGGDRRNDRDDDRRGDDDDRRDARDRDDREDGDRSPRNEQRQTRKVIVRGGGPGMHGPMGQGMPFNPQMFAGQFMVDEDEGEEVTVDVQVEVEPEEFDIGFAPGPRLGVGIGELDDATRETLGLEDGGIMVNQVFPGSVAEKAGLKQGDVIVSLAGGEVNDLAAFVELIRSRTAGDAVSLEVLRAGTDEPVTIEVNLEDGPPAGSPGKSMPMSIHLDPSTMKALHERIGGFDPALQAKIVESFDDFLGEFGPEAAAQFQQELRAQMATRWPDGSAPRHGAPHVITVPGVPMTPHTPRTPHTPQTPPAATSHHSSCRAICIDGDLRIEVESDSDDEAVDVEITNGSDTIFDGEVDVDGDLSEVPEDARDRVRELLSQLKKSRH